MTTIPAAIKLGDIVVLKSGGPKMTVSNIEHQTIRCIWFHDASGWKLNWAVFPAGVLKVVETQEDTCCCQREGTVNGPDVRLNPDQWCPVHGHG